MKVHTGFASKLNFDQSVCATPVLAGRVRRKEQSPFSAPRERRVGNKPALSLSPELPKFRTRLQTFVERAEDYDGLTKTERKYLTSFITEDADEGGQARLDQTQFGERHGNCRRTAIRILGNLVRKGFLTSGTTYEWVTKVSPNGVRYRMKQRRRNVYRIAGRFMSILKAARRLIRRNVTTEAKPIRSGSEDRGRESQKLVLRWVKEGSQYVQTPMMVDCDIGLGCRLRIELEQLRIRAVRWWQLRRNPPYVPSSLTSGVPEW